MKKTAFRQAGNPRGSDPAPIADGDRLEKPCRVVVTLTAAERGALESLASTRSPVDARTLLAYFVGDLVGSDKSGGSDERLRAHDWLDRRFGPEWYAQKHYGKGDS